MCSCLQLARAKSAVPASVYYSLAQTVSFARRGHRLQTTKATYSTPVRLLLLRSPGCHMPPPHPHAPSKRIPHDRSPHRRRFVRLDVLSLYTVFPKQPTHTHWSEHCRTRRTARPGCHGAPGPPPPPPHPPNEYPTLARPLRRSCVRLDVQPVPHRLVCWPFSEHTHTHKHAGAQALRYVVVPRGSQGW